MSAPSIPLAPAVAVSNAPGTSVLHLGSRFRAFASYPWARSLVGSQHLLLTRPHPSSFAGVAGASYDEPESEHVYVSSEAFRFCEHGMRPGLAPVYRLDGYGNPVEIVAAGVIEGGEPFAPIPEFEAKRSEVEARKEREALVADALRNPPRLPLGGNRVSPLDKDAVKLGSDGMADALCPRWRQLLATGHVTLVPATATDAPFVVCSPGAKALLALADAMPDSLFVREGDFVACIPAGELDAKRHAVLDTPKPVTAAIIAANGDSAARAAALADGLSDAVASLESLLVELCAVSQSRKGISAGAPCEGVEFIAGRTRTVLRDDCGTPGRIASALSPLFASPEAADAAVFSISIPHAPKIAEFLRARLGAKNNTILLAALQKGCEGKSPLIPVQSKRGLVVRAAREVSQSISVMEKSPSRTGEIPDSEPPARKRGSPKP